MERVLSVLIILVICSVISAKEYHVFKYGDDNNTGFLLYPFKTIQAAANVALPGDTITVHDGIYRERVIPPHGGESDSNRITYRAADGEKVEIKGSEIIKGWVKFTEDVWKVTLPNLFFGNYNPYKDSINGDWFKGLGKIHHTGEVYLNGKSLYESITIEGVLNPQVMKGKFDPEGSTKTWYCESDENNTYIYANFQGADPNHETVEINIRNSCFYPDQTGINYITVRGFEMSQAATQWATSTGEQIGIIGTFWSKGWIIEDNIVHDSKCAGITLGKDRKSGHNPWSQDRSKPGSWHFQVIIDKVIEDGWSKENVGSHIVRNNTVYNCEQAGICGSLGAPFSQIYNNYIYNIWTKRLFDGSEIAGIKFHAPIDMLIKNNRICYCGRGIWLDWMTQGTRVTGNLLYNNTTQDLLIEVSHGPFLVDNNIFLSDRTLKDYSQGGAYVHNLFGGDIAVNKKIEHRSTPYFLPHSTKLVGTEKFLFGDNRFYNNIFIASDYDLKSETTLGYKVYNRLKVYDIHEVRNITVGYVKNFGSPGLKAYDTVELPMYVHGNIYFDGAIPYGKEINGLQINFNPEIKVNDDGATVNLTFHVNDSFHKIKCQLVTTQLLGKAKIPDQFYENPDGTPLVIDLDYFGNKRDAKNPAPGPFENLKSGEITMKVW